MLVRKDRAAAHPLSPALGTTTSQSGVARQAALKAVRDTGPWKRSTVFT